MIQKSAMIVSLSMGQWAARKHDRKITDEVREQHNASADAGRYNKALAAKGDLEAVTKASSGARDYYYTHTSPWGDNNERILKAEKYFDFLSEMTKFKEKRDIAIAEFISRYPDVIEEAKTRLNGMFNENDYPRLTHIESKFFWKLTFMPVPDTDFRINLTDEQVAELRTSVTNEVTNRLQGAMADAWKRIKDQLSAMKGKLSQKDAIFRDSLFGNLKELIDILPGLNLTDDPNLTLACQEMSGILTNPDAVRNNPDLRQIKADEVEKVLNQFSQFFPS